MAKRCIRSCSIAAIVCGAAIVVGGCGKSKDDKNVTDVDPARTFAAEKAAAARELEEMQRRRGEIAAANQQDIHRETEQTFAKFAADRPSLNTAEEEQLQTQAVERLRARMTDPSTMQSRNVHFNADRTAICLDINYMEGGKYVGYRRAFITPDITWVEPGPDDVSHRLFELRLEKMGCGAGK